MTVKGWTTLVVFVLCCVLVVGCGTSIGAQPTAMESVQTVPTSKPTTVPSATVEYTATPIPSATNIPEPTVTPTQTSTATPTRGNRVWTQQQFGVFMSKVGSWFLIEGSEPPIPREGDSIAQLLDQFHYDESIDRFVGPVDAAELDPDAICAWVFSKLQEGHSVLIILDGEVFSSVTREERWVQFSSAVGDVSREPYCPQFDQSLEVPIFENLD